MGAKEEVMKLFTPGNLLRAALAAVIMALLMPFLDQLMTASQGLFPGAVAVVAAAALAIALVLNPGPERLLPDLVTILFVIGVGSIMASFIPQLALDVSVQNLLSVQNLVAAYLSLGLGALAAEKVGLEL